MTCTSSNTTIIIKQILFTLTPVTCLNTNKIYLLINLVANSVQVLFGNTQQDPEIKGIQIKLYSSVLR